MHDECRALFEKLSEYLDGELDAETCEKIINHLEDCPDCENCFESLQKTVDLCKAFPREKVPEEVHQRLKAALEACLNLGRD